MGEGIQKWVRRLKAGDQSAFLPFYEKSSPGLMRFLLWKTNGDRALSEDILQESYVRFLLNLDKLEGDAELISQRYLFQIVKNCLVDKVARSPGASKQHIPLEAMGDIIDPQESMKQERAIELRELSVAMSSLGERECEIVWLRDGLGLSHREVADQVGITEEASRQAYVRAKRSLLDKLSDRLLPKPIGVPAYAVPEMS